VEKGCEAAGLEDEMALGVLLWAVGGGGFEDAAFLVDGTVATVRMDVRRTVVDGAARRREESSARRHEAQIVIFLFQQRWFRRKR
jgi:hypothetical protein